MNATYLIPENNLPELEVRIAKLNKRAKKLGVPEIAFIKTQVLSSHCVALPRNSQLTNHIP